MSLLLGTLAIVSACARRPDPARRGGRQSRLHLDTDQQVRFEAHPVYGTAVDGMPLRWPDGYVGRPAPGGVEILDERGNIAARTGDTITVCDSGNDDGYWPSGSASRRRIADPMDTTITETAITREIARLRSLTGPQITSVAGDGALRTPGSWPANVWSRGRPRLGIDIDGLTRRLRSETTADHESTR